MRLTRALAIISSVALVSSAALLSAGVSGPNAAAPPETAQFSFAIGEWSCKTRGMTPDGTVQEGPPATWTFYYILDGWAIQDDWVSQQPNGSYFRGTNIRSFNPETRRWDNRWLQQGDLRWKYYSAEQVGDTMVMTGGEGKDAMDRECIDRNTFHSITEDSWIWRKDRSFDGGESWIEGVAVIEATRVK